MKFLINLRSQLRSQLCLYTSLFTLMLLSTSVLSATLKVGDMAPNFSLASTDGNTYTLSQFKGKEAVVIAWFPRAHTRGCTIECKSLADNGHLIRKYQVTYFMASVDPLEENRSFAKKQKADFPLLSDPEKTTAKAYDVLNLFGIAKRITVYIGVDGKVLAIDKDVEPKTSAEDMIAHLARLDVALREE
ncbi:MAG: peroxiredoxin Q/BCP [Phenylobacterium sp.]|jgi:peroxiredoxin Q/BCP